MNPILIDNVTRDDITYKFMPDGNIQIKVPRMRAFVYDGPKHRNLQELYPDLFPDVLGLYQQRKRRRIYQGLASNLNPRNFGFKSRKSLQEFLEEHDLESKEALLTYIATLDDFDITAAYTLTDWKELGFTTLAEAREWQALVRKYMPSVLKVKARLYDRAFAFICTDQLRFQQPIRLNTSFRGAFMSYILPHVGLAADHLKYLDSIASTLVDTIKGFQGADMKACSVSFGLKAYFVAPGLYEGEEVQSLLTLKDENGLRAWIAEELLNDERKAIDVWSKVTRLHQVYGTQASEVVDSMMREMSKEIEKSNHVGSGLIMLCIDSGYLNLYEKDPLTAGSWIPTPDWIASRKAVINPRNINSDDCALYAVFYAKHHEELKPDSLKKISSEVTEGVNHYRKLPAYTRIQFPLPLDRRMLNHMEDLFDVNIYLWCAINGSQSFVPFDPSPRIEGHRVDVLILRITDDLGSHYVWVKNPSALVRRNASSDNQFFPCYKCCAPCSSKESLKEHMRLCVNLEGGLEKMPPTCSPQKPDECDEDYQERVAAAGRPELAFNAHHSLIQCPAYMDLDFEASNESCTGQGGGKTTNLTKQVPNSAKLLVYQNHPKKLGEVCNECTTERSCPQHSKVLHTETFEGSDCVRQLIEAIKHWSRIIYEKFYTKIVPIKWTKESRKAFDTATDCCICHGKLMKDTKWQGDGDEDEEDMDFEASMEAVSEVRLKKVAHHCHYTGHVYGAAHNSCNLKVKVKRKIPVFAHYNMNYDGHFILDALRPSDYDQLRVLPMNNEKYKAFTMLMKDTSRIVAVDKSVFKYKLGRGEGDVYAPVGTPIEGRVYEDHDRPGFVKFHNKDLFYAIVRSIQAAQGNRRAEYCIDFKDSYLFLQTGLDAACKSMADKDFEVTSMYVDTLLSKHHLTNDRLRRFIDTYAVTNDSHRDDPARVSTMLLICQIMGWAKDLKKKQGKFSKSDPEYIELQREIEEVEAREYTDFVHHPPTARRFTFLLCRQKGVYPYEWFDSLSKMEYPGLPPKEAFFSRLHDQVEDVSQLKDGKTLQKRWEFANLVWHWYGFQTFRDYHMHYLDLDVYLLTDAMNNFRRYFIDSFEIDPIHFTTLPGAAWQACLRHTKCKMELFGPGEVEMYHFCEAGIRGGLSTVGTLRYARANNPNLPDHYYPKLRQSYINYVDCNGLYGFIMKCRKLPYRGYQWVDLDKDMLMGIDVDGDVGYFVEVDVHLPLDKHEWQADFPCLPESIAIKRKDLSPFQQNLTKRDGDKKLMATLRPKEHYIVHLKTLQEAIRQGWIVDKVHRALEFEQRAWMEPYITFNTLKRLAAKEVDDSYGSDFYKLMSNIVFGKTMEDIRKHENVTVIRTDCDYKTAKRYLNDPHFGGFIPINSEIMAVKRSRRTITLNKPVMVGMAILDLSKQHMQDFWYNTLKKDFGSDIKLIYTDTDSFIFQVFTSIDFDAYMRNNPRFHDSTPGLFSNETDSPIVEAAAIRSKMYSLMLADKSQKSTAKGVNKTVRKTLMHDAYVDCILQSKSSDVVQFQLRSKGHTVKMMRQKKLGLSPFNDKSYLIDSIRQLPHGHKDIPRP